MARKTKWYHGGVLPINYAFVSKEEWEKELKYWDMEKEEYPTSAGHCRSFKDPDCGSVSFITFNNDRVKGLNNIELAGIVAHEVTHARQYLFKNYMKELDPGEEVEAYITQIMTMNILDDLLKYMKRDFNDKRKDRSSKSKRSSK